MTVAKTGGAWGSWAVPQFFGGGKSTCKFFMNGFCRIRLWKGCSQWCSWGKNPTMLMPSLYSSLGCETGTDTVSKGSFPCDSVRNDSARSVLCGYQWLVLIWFTAQVVNATCLAFNYIPSLNRQCLGRRSYSYCGPNHAQSCAHCIAHSYVGTGHCQCVYQATCSHSKYCRPAAQHTFIYLWYIV